MSEPDLIVCDGERVHMVAERLGLRMVVWSTESFDEKLFHELKMKFVLEFLIAVLATQG